MEKPEFQPVTVRSRKQPYVGMGVLMVPLIIFTGYVAIDAGIASNFWASPLGLTFILLSFYYFLYSLRLILTHEKIIYKKMWRTWEISLHRVESIQRGPTLFGGAFTMEIRSKRDEEPIIVNIANFERSVLKAWVKAVLEKEPGIKMSNF